MKNEVKACAWGLEFYGGVPSSVDLTNVAAAMCGFYACVAVKNDGTAVAWGEDGGDASTLDLTNVAAVAGGAFQATTNSGVSAKGDPHLQNIHGERFDLMRPGKAVLIQIPRGNFADDSLLTVEADAHRLGGSCADIYFVTVNVTGAWADKVRAGGFTFTAAEARDETSQMRSWTKFGPLDLKVAHGYTKEGIQYLNFHVKHLGRAGAAVGGLLGEDDHTEASEPEEKCRKTMTVMKGTSSEATASEATASV